MSNVFLGLPIAPLDSEILLNLLDKAHPSWQNHSAIRWTAVTNYHATLHFFGQIHLELLKDLAQHLSEYIQCCKIFSIKINKLDNFPKSNSNLIAAYIALDLPLAELYRQVQQAVKDYGFPIEMRPFLPHITLCRTRRRSILQMDPIILPDYSIHISKLVLYQTQSASQGNHYQPLQVWPFSK